MNIAKRKVAKKHKVRGIVMTDQEYRAFVAYLNRFKAQSFTKADVTTFLEAYDTEPEFRRLYNRLGRKE